MVSKRAEAEQLEQVLSGRLPADEASRRLRRLADLATTVSDVTTVETPDPAFKAALRAELLEAVAAGRQTWWTRVRDRIDEATASWRYSLRTAIATAVASSLVGTAAVAAASQSALPGDVLYRVKSWTEDARLAFASGDVAQGRLHLAFARERLQEVADGLPRLSDDEIAGALDAMDRESAQGAENLLAASLEDPTRALLDELTAFTGAQRDQLVELTDRLPLSLQPIAEQSLEVLRRIDLQVASLADPGTCALCGGSPVSAPIHPPRVILPGDGPAAPPVGCDCIEAPAAPLPREGSGTDTTTTDGSAATDGADAGGDTTIPPADSEPSPSDTRLVVPELPEPLDEVGQIVDDLIGDVVGDTPLEGPVSDVGSTVDDVGSTVGDVLDPVTGSVTSTPTPTPSPSPSPTVQTSDGLVDGLLGG